MPAALQSRLDPTTALLQLFQFSWLDERCASGQLLITRDGLVEFDVGVDELPEGEVRFESGVHTFDTSTTVLFVMELRKLIREGREPLDVHPEALEILLPQELEELLLVHERRPA